MKWLLLIIAIFTWDQCHAKTELQCINEMREVLKLSEEDFTMKVTECSVKMLEGDRYLINSDNYWRRIRIKLYPRQYDRKLASDSEELDDMGVVERGHRLMLYVSCLEFSGAMKLYINQCTSQ